MKVLKFKPSLARKIIEGYKTTTIRLEPFKVGEEVIIKSGNLTIGKAKIIEVRKIRLKEINRKIVIEEGFYSKEALLSYLKRIYPKLTEEDFVYLIKFKFI